jgi:hypothetical protein
MSFAGDVKTELCRAGLNRKCCARAEAYGVLLHCNTFTPRLARIITEHEGFAQRLPLLFQKTFQVSFDQISDGPGKRSLSITAPEKLAVLHRAFGLDPNALALHVNFAVLEEPCCRFAFLRGTFLAGGSVTDPAKDYHLELSVSHKSAGRELLALMREEGLSPKVSDRKSGQVIYFKQSNFIEDFLTAIGAPISAMGVMTAKLEKDLNGSINRQVNCDAANLDKTVEAAQTQLEAIRRLQARGQLDHLPEKLQQAARLRLLYPEYTLSQLAQQHDPPLSKSTLNHRLRRLLELGRL